MMRKGIVFIGKERTEFPIRVALGFNLNLDKENEALQNVFKKMLIFCIKL